MFPAIRVFNEALHQLHKIRFWGFDHRAVCLGCNMSVTINDPWQNKNPTTMTNFYIFFWSAQNKKIFAHFVRKTKKSSHKQEVKNISHLLNAWSSDSVQMSLNCFEIFRMFWAQKFKSCLKETWFFFFFKGGVGVILKPAFILGPWFYTLTRALRPSESSLPSLLLISSGTASVTMDTNSSSLP